MSVHEFKEPMTCRRCGGLIAPQNVQCRRCGYYRDAGPIENALLSNLIPNSVSRYAGTVLIGALIVLWALVVALVTKGDALPSASSFTLIQFGAMNGPFVEFGQWWRAGTSMFLHHGVLHLAMNLYALVIVGRLYEELTDRYHVVGVFLLGGLLSMALSHFWYALGIFGPAYLYTSAGASGAVCALIGATFLHARRQPSTDHIARTMLSWSLFMLVFGLMVGGINNAAHIGGWLAGAALAWGFSHFPDSTRLPKWLCGTTIPIVIACFVLGFLSTRGLPAYVHDDAYPRQMLMFSTKEGTPWNRSIQVKAWEACRVDIENGADHEQAKAHKVLEDCRLNLALNGSQQGAWYLMELAYRGVDQPRKAHAAHRVARRLQGDGS